MLDLITALMANKEILDFITALGRNIALLFSLTFLYSLIWPQLKFRNLPLYRPVVGALFGIMGVFVMQTPIPLAVGIFTDGRDIIIALAAIMEGPEAAIVAGVMIILVRWQIGGVGAFPGMGIAATAIVVGWLAKRYLHAPISKAKPRFFIGLGLVLTILGRFWVLTLPNKELALMLIRTTSIQLAIISVLETLLLGYLLAREARRQETETALAESENRFAKAFRASPIATAISTLQEGRFVDVNDSFLKLIGFSRNEVIGHTIADVNTWVYPEQRDKMLQSLISDQTVYNQDIELRSQNGDIHNVLISADRIELGGEPHLLTLSFDITDRKQFEATLQKLNAELEQRVQERTSELQRQQQLLQTILDSMGEGVMYSSDFMIRYVNPALQEMCGYTAAELIGQPNRILKDESAASLDVPIFSSELIESDQTWRGETPLRYKDGHSLRAALTVRRLSEVLPGVGGTVTLIRDITVEKELQEQKSRFIANASHELRTPLTNMSTRLYLLRNQPAKAEEHIGVMERVTHQMSTLVEDLLDVARFERGTVRLMFASVSLQTLIDDVVKVQQAEAEGKGIVLSAVVPQNPLHTKGDANRLAQVMTNLVVNAIHHTSEGGSIIVLLDQGTDGAIAMLSVRDTGVGIQAEYLSRVFEPFFRISDGPWRGTGLGLSISKEIVEQHGGSLSVESVVGSGSTFTMCLPLNLI